MKTLIPPPAFFQPEILQKEIENIFHKHWLFACSLTELANSNDYVCLDFAGNSVVIQNFEGQIRAFDNVCTHRYARIQEGACGNRTFRCPYHGWFFNADGIPYGIPSRPLIREITPQTLCDYRLARWHVRILGPLVFIKKDDGQPLPEDDFERQLGKFYPIFERFTNAFDTLIENTHYTVKSNWKAFIENTLEGYHVDAVHTATLNRIVPVGCERIDADTTDIDFEAQLTCEYLLERANKVFFIFTGKNSAVYNAIKPELTEKVQKAYKFLARRPIAYQGYKHYYMFPNFVLASTRGESFSLQRFLPVDAQTTLLTSYSFSTKIEGEMTKMERAMHRIFYEATGNLIKQIFEEDAQICEMVQKGLTIASRGGVLSDEEERVCEFHKAYLATMEKI